MNPPSTELLQKMIREETARDLNMSRRLPRAWLCGMNHVSAPLAVREQFTLNARQADGLIHCVRTGFDDCQFMILSTCNRTELMAFSDDPGFDVRLRETFLNINPAIMDQETPPPIYEYNGIEVARHLFAVTAGLDSLLLGENQIKQQLKKAFETSLAAGGVGAEMHRLYACANHCSKRIRSETELNLGTLEVGKAAVLKGEMVLGGLEGRQCLVIGSGKIGRLAIRAIAERKPSRFLIVNRSIENAEIPAREAGAEARSLEELPALLADADFILGAAYAPELVLSESMYREACRGRRKDTTVCMVDVGVPHILDKGLNSIGHVKLFDIEEMQGIVEQHRRQRASAAQHAWKIVEEEIESYRSALKSAELAPMIQRLDDRISRILEEDSILPETHPDAGNDDTVNIQRHRLKQKLMHEMIREVRDLLL
jgi:glutamyl-tRNA reductase